MRSLPVPDIHDVIRDAEPLDDPVSFRYPASVRRRYETLDSFPERLLVLGDAVCSFNPVYGQGMTVAALEALTLREHLRSGRNPDPLDFLKDVSAVIDVPWESSAGGDLGYPEVEGRGRSRYGWPTPTSGGSTARRAGTHSSPGRSCAWPVWSIRPRG
ncbi:hypothetical protein KGD82_07565 [Nocardiopsis eucommiae]|uniref:Uncharacterized protein n=1 Tax=Nocardiopsis eucommiae TaxID=2831970 RepID=A0A975LAR4_9ACTN|nr:hypothetical protein KGD82_07565 [Nocardiopsis eucommiae]